MLNKPVELLDGVEDVLEQLPAEVERVKKIQERMYKRSKMNI